MRLHSHIWWVPVFCLAQSALAGAKEFCQLAGQLGFGATSLRAAGLIKKMSALQKRVGLLELTGHEFLNAARSQERTTFADGTTVTVDWDANTVTISPELNEP